MCCVLPLVPLRATDKPYHIKAAGRVWWYKAEAVRLADGAPPMSQWRDQAVTKKYCSRSGDEEGPICGHGSDAIRTDHWSCCGVGTRQAACTQVRHRACCRRRLPSLVVSWRCLVDWIACRVFVAVWLCGCVAVCASPVAYTTSWALALALPSTTVVASWVESGCLVVTASVAPQTDHSARSAWRTKPLRWALRRLVVASS